RHRVAEAVRQCRSKTSIFDDPDFVAAQKRVGNEGAMFYVCGREVTRNAYPVTLVILTAVQGFSGVPAMDQLPAMQRILDYTGSDLASAKPLPDGIMLTRVTENPLLSPASA